MAQLGVNSLAHDIVNKEIHFLNEIRQGENVLTKVHIEGKGEGVEGETLLKTILVGCMDLAGPLIPIKGQLP